jgi:hypothetical protein
MVAALGFKRKPCDRLIQLSWNEDPVDVDQTLVDALFIRVCCASAQERR